MAEVDLAVIGAGPAGLAAAATAGAAGLSVALLDEQPAAGGQIYRDAGRADAARLAILGRDYARGRALIETVHRTDGLRHVPGAVVWAIEDGFHIHFTAEGRAGRISARRVLLATGALERAMPLPGWTLPGVMTAGAAQILLKGSGVLAGRATLAGSGPLLYLVAAQMIRAGVPPRALVETQTRTDFAAAMRHLPGALRGWRGLAKGLSLLAELRRAGVRRFTGAEALAVEGTDRVEALTFRARGKTRRIACDTVLLHHGVVPNTQAARSLGVTHRWNAAQHAFAPVLDRWGASDRAGLFIAGDGAGIGGAVVAEIAGRLAALRLAEEAGILTTAERDARAAPLFRARAREMAIRPFLDTAYPPCREALEPADSTVICRCEEVTAGDIRAAAALGCPGPNQAKSFTRAGMGPCQGRFCGLSVSALLAEATGQSPDATGYFRIRPPLKPVTLAELAAMDTTITPEGERDDRTDRHRPPHEQDRQA